MKTISKLLLFILSAIMLSFVSCVDYLDTYPEGGMVTSDQQQEIVAARPERLAADIAGMYKVLGQQYVAFGTAYRHDDFSYPSFCLAWDANGSDFITDISNYNWFSTPNEYLDRNYTYASNIMRWSVFYKQIKMANDILNAIPQDTDNPVLLAYKGQALAVRAFDYLSLVPYYQFKYKGNEDKPAVPLVTNEMTTEELENLFRRPVRDVYELIINDLNEAIILLDGFVRTSKSEIDQRVAYGLRARANLYMENWADAASDADNALAGYDFYSISDVSQPTFISANDPNWMWAIIIGPDNIDGVLANWPSKLSSFTGYGYTTAVRCYKQINNLLFNKIPSSDVRKGWWVDENRESPNLANVTWNHPDTSITGNGIALGLIPGIAAFFPYTQIKWGQAGGIGDDVNWGDWSIMRAEEMVLIKAEATGMTNEALGKSILQEFISNYRDPSYDVNASTRSFQDEVWFHRRVELWGEGFAMADLMRLSKPLVRFHDETSSVPNKFRFNMTADDGWRLMRIPRSEIDSNAGISEADNNNEGTLPVSGQNSGLRDGVTD